MFDGLFSDQLLFLIPLHQAHDAGPHDADHLLLRDAAALHLLLAAGDNLGETSEIMIINRWSLETDSEGQRLEETHLSGRDAQRHLLLQLFLQLLTSAQRLPVTGEVRELLQPSVSEVLGEILVAALVHRKQLLQHQTHTQAER